MSKITEAFRRVRVFNSYEFYGTTPYICYSAYEYRTSAGGYAEVIERGVNLSGRSLDDLHWRDRIYAEHNAGTVGRKFRPLVPGTGAKKNAIEQATEWARTHYKIEEWKRDPFGTYGPAEFVDARLKALREQMSALPPEVS